MSWIKNAEGKYEWVEGPVAQGIGNLYDRADNYLKQSGANQWMRNALDYLRPLIPGWVSGQMSPRAEGFWASLGAPGTTDPRENNWRYNQMSLQDRSRYDTGTNVGNMAFNSLLPAIGATVMASGARAAGRGLPVNRPTPGESHVVLKDIAQVRASRRANQPWNTDLYGLDARIAANDGANNTFFPELGMRRFSDFPIGLRPMAYRMLIGSPEQGWATQSEYMDMLRNQQRPQVNVRPLP